VRFSVWWYLRFFLPIWPFMMLGTAAVCAWVFRNARPWLRILVVLGVIALGWNGLRLSNEFGVMERWKESQHYASVANLVQKRTQPNSVIVSMQHSGSIRYYGERVTLRYDHLDPEWVDRAFAWFAERGVHTYLAVDYWELPEVKKMWGKQAAWKRIAGATRLTTDAGSVVFVNLTPTDPMPTAEEVTETFSRPVTVQPGQPPTLILH
jgi:hypothetical protein